MIEKSRKSSESEGSHEPTAQALTASGFVDYHAGAIVSRTILKKKTGNVTVFAFDAGEGLSEHTAPFDALVFVLDGAAEITVSGRTFSAEAGQFVVMPADEPHSLHARERFKMALIMIRS